MQGILTVHTDGGARGNPGPAAIGMHIQADSLDERFGRCIGNTTNNVAEYTALLEAAERVHQLVESAAPTEVHFFLDSELVVKQLNGQYRVKDPGLKLLYDQVQVGLRTLRVPYRITHVPRAQNKVADRLVNEALDGNV